MKQNLELRKYSRVKNKRSTQPLVRVQGGKIFLNRILVERIDCVFVDLFVDENNQTILVKEGNDFKLCKTIHGRGVISASLFLKEFDLSEGFFPAEEHEGGYIFEYECN
ncbi:MAG: hypothetical protein CMO55_23385 [Verrucomicrobiales bacterium]|nr:hypothetical protein [Verrucomicrobiales bacterium]